MPPPSLILHALAPHPTLTDGDAIQSQLAGLSCKQRQESLEKRISELEESLEKGQKSNSSQRKTPNADKEEITAEMYIIVQRTSLYIVV